MARTLVLIADRPSFTEQDLVFLDDFTIHYRQAEAAICATTIACVLEQDGRLPTHLLYEHSLNCRMIAETIARRALDRTRHNEQIIAPHLARPRAQLATQTLLTSPAREIPPPSSPISECLIRGPRPGQARTPPLDPEIWRALLLLISLLDADPDGVAMLVADRERITEIRAALQPPLRNFSWAQNTWYQCVQLPPNAQRLLSSFGRAATR